MVVIATPTLTIEPDSDLLIFPNIIVDWNNDGTFDSSEDISVYITSLDWTRGKEPEQVATPTGNAVIQIADPTGIFTPNSTFWGVNGTVNIGRGVKASITYQGSSYTVFRGVIQRISNTVRPGNDQRATIFCTDELENLKRRIITVPNTSVSTAATPTDDRPFTDKTFGASTDGSTSVIAHILDEAAWPSTRRAINEPGNTAEFWWAYKESALDALHEVERHEGKRSIVFINSSGDLTFYSSTHNNGTTYAAAFGAGIGPLVNLVNGQFSARNVVNRSIATIFTREAQAFNSTQEITFPTAAIAVGDTFSWIAPFTNDPINGVVGITAQIDSTAGLSIIGVTSGSSYASSANPDMVKYQVLGGGTAIQYFIANPSTEQIIVSHPEGFSGSTEVFPQVYAKLAPIAFETTFADPTSTGIYGSREVRAEYPFFGTQPKAVLRAQQDVANNSTAHMEGMAISLTGSDSDSVRQILTRGIFDRIRVNSPEMHFKQTLSGGSTIDSLDFYITKGDWTLDVGGLLGVSWTLDESTKATA